MQAPRDSRPACQQAASGRNSQTPTQHGLQQSGPVSEPEHFHEHAQLLAAAAACAGRVPVQPARIADAVQDRVQRERGQIQCGEQVRQAPCLPRPKLCLLLQLRIQPVDQIPRPGSCLYHVLWLLS